MDFMFLKVTKFGKAAAMTDVGLLSQAATPVSPSLREPATLLEAALRVCPSNVKELPFQLMGRCGARLCAPLASLQFCLVCRRRVSPCSRLLSQRLMGLTDKYDVIKALVAGAWTSQAIPRPCLLPLNPCLTPPSAQRLRLFSHSVRVRCCGCPVPGCYGLPFFCFFACLSS